MMGSQSLPKGVGQDYALVLRQARPKASDGSLSDTQAIDTASPYAPWLRHRSVILKQLLDIIVTIYDNESIEF